ncbi:hypothetical protein [Aquimarina sp. SS2-1]|uniref:hypothetical protein n=1 Tax=Aquimarina besae TaxID=3342247 RepID=UPI00367322BE
MKNYALLLLFALICCKSESKSSNDTEKRNQINATENIENLSAENSAAIMMQKTYTAVLKDANNNFTQNLTVSWLSDDTIQYVLTFENQSCKKTTIGGRATILNPGKEPFMISYKGASVEVNKYQDQKEGLKLQLQIDTTNQDKAVVDVWSTEDGDNENCKPSSVVMVEQK